MLFGAYLTGFGIGLSLILAIGAQNAFVLRQGLRREHILTVVLICSISDALLIAFGVTGFHQILNQVPWIEPLLRYGGASFLIIYGLKNAYTAIQKGEGLNAASSTTNSWLRTSSTCLALTWANPHVYIDTVVLVGSISSRFPNQEMLFAGGAMTASFCFFFSLGFGAILLRPLLASPLAWRFLDGGIALIMWFIAAQLLFEF